jgi:hypothetical protein
MYDELPRPKCGEERLLHCASLTNAAATPLSALAQQCTNASIPSSGGRQALLKLLLQSKLPEMRQGRSGTARQGQEGSPRR